MGICWLTDIPQVLRHHYPFILCEPCSAVRQIEILSGIRTVRSRLWLLKLYISTVSTFTRASSGFAKPCGGNNPPPIKFHNAHLSCYRSLQKKKNKPLMIMMWFRRHWLQQNAFFFFHEESKSSVVQNFDLFVCCGRNKIGWGILNRMVVITW